MGDIPGGSADQRMKRGDLLKQGHKIMEVYHDRWYLWVCVDSSWSKRGDTDGGLKMEIIKPELEGRRTMGGTREDKVWKRGNLSVDVKEGKEQTNVELIVNLSWINLEY